MLVTHHVNNVLVLPILSVLYVLLDQNISYQQLVKLQVYVILLHVLLVIGRMMQDKFLYQIQLSLYVLLAQQLKHVVLNVHKMVKHVQNVQALDFFIKQDKLLLLVQMLVQQMDGMVQLTYVINAIAHVFNVLLVLFKIVQSVLLVQNGY